MSRCSRSLVAIAALLALVGTACSGPPDGGVGITSIATDLAFRPPPEPDRPAAPAGIGPGVDRAPFRVVDPPPRPAESPEFEPASPPECPFAPLTAAAEEVAPVDITARPEVGRYRWVIEGHQQTEELGPISLGGLKVRSVLEVEDAGNGFTFTTEENDVQVGVTAKVRTTYLVTEDELSVEDVNIVDAGVYLTRIVREGPDGEEREFNPSPPILMFPTPAEIGTTPLGGVAPGGIGVQPEQMDTVGIDPRTLEAMTHTGSIVGKRQVDACGELLDTFLVRAEQTFVGGDGEELQRRYYYGVAPHMGGLIVFEGVAVPCLTEEEEPVDESPGNPEGIECTPEPILAYNAWIGQLEPGSDADGDTEDD